MQKWIFTGLVYILNCAIVCLIVCLFVCLFGQETVDKAKPFPDVLEEFEQWLTDHELGSTHKFAIVTDG